MCLSAEKKVKRRSEAATKGAFETEGLGDGSCTIAGQEDYGGDT